MSFIGFIISIVLFSLIATARIALKGLVSFISRCSQNVKSNNFNRYSNIATA